MELRPFGATGFQVAAIGQGTWQMERDDRKKSIAALRRGLELGLTHLDTAELYGSGVVEKEIVAEVIDGRRDQVFLVSKVMPGNASYEGTLAACERSLKRLRTDRLDCYLLHWPGNHPLEDTIRAFETLQKDGKIKSYGVSNFDEEGLARAVKIAGPGKIAQNQVLYHLGERSIEHAVLGACEANKVALVGYSPFGAGNFNDRDSELRAVTAAHQSTPRQVALAYLIRRHSLFAIPKTSTVTHVEENAGAVRLKLTAEDIKKMDAAFPLPRRRRGVPML